MEAVIREGGKQYRVQEGDKILIDRRPLSPGSEIEFSEVLYIKQGDEVRIGTPTVPGARVVGEAKREVKGKKLYPFHFRRRKGSRTRRGHRQPYTEVEIQRIEG